MQKNPKTAQGSKKSAKGLLMVTSEWRIHPSH
jgi:hypothetical protein